MSGDFKHQLWITLGVFLGVILLFGGGLLALEAKVSSRVGEITNQRGLIQQASTLTETLANLKNEKQVAGGYSKSLEQLVTNRDDLVVGFSRWLESEAKLYSVGASFNFEGSEVSPTADSFGYARLSLKLSGPLTSVASFLKHLERESMRFLMNFESFNISQNQNDYSVSVAGLVYFK
ncbi:MAG: hypothetical protein AAB738_02970 [Patescibacteria group bacterium]